MANRRKRSTEHDITDYDALLNAIKDIIINKRSKKSTAAEYKISRISLLRYVAKFIAEVSDILAVSDELKIVPMYIIAFTYAQIAIPIWININMISFH